MLRGLWISWDSLITIRRELRLGRLGLAGKLTDATYQVIGEGLSFRDWQRLYRRREIVRTQEKLMGAGFDVTDSAIIVFQNSVHI